jgi:prenylcysteine alpha-carboxyl methylesterase
VAIANPVCTSRLVLIAKLALESTTTTKNPFHVVKKQNSATTKNSKLDATATTMQQANIKLSPLRFLTLWTIPIVLRDLVAMTIYVTLLLPGFLQMLWFYVRNKDRVAVPYKSTSCRNKVDVYGKRIDASSTTTTTTTTSQRPVVLFLPGGAFLIGYKMWAALFAQALSTFDVLVVAADYLNYPFGTVPEMIEDVQDVIQWTLDHCHEYGGNPDKIVVVGQSAGAHLGMMALLRKRQEKEEQYKIKGFIGLSGIFDLSDASDLYAHHGLSEAFVEEQLFGNQLRQCDPTRALAEVANATDNLPPIEIWHGTADKTVSFITV